MRALALLVALVLPLAAAALAPHQTEAPPTGIVSLAALRNRARPLLVFAPRPDDPQLEIQLRRLAADAPSLTERNVVVIAIPYQSPTTTAATLTATDAETARRRFNVPPTDFAVILLGKDGGEKLRSAKPLTLDQLRQTIDAMPMRQEEMRRHP